MINLNKYIKEICDNEKDYNIDEFDLLLNNIIRYMDIKNRIWKIENINYDKNYKKNINIFDIIGKFLFSIKHFSDKRVITIFRFKLTLKKMMLFL